MKTQELLQQLEGYTNITDIQRRLNITKERAIYLIHRLRKNSYVKTKYLPNKKRSYYIAISNAIGGTSYLEILNSLNPIGLKIAENQPYRIYGKTLNIEETLIYALQQKTVRHILASLSLFRKINNWSFLYKMAKKENFVRPIAALYEIARLVIPKVRRMPRRFKTLASPKKNDSYIFIIDKFSSDTFQSIENKWKVYLPINMADLEDVKREFMSRQK